MSFPLFSFSIFFWRKTKQKHNFLSFFERKNKIVCEEQLHFIWKIIKYSILHFQQGNELNQRINDNEMNKIEFVNFESILCYLLLSSRVRTTNNTMKVLLGKFVNQRQTLWTVKNQRHQFQSDFCSWSSKSTKLSIWHVLHCGQNDDEYTQVIITSNSNGNSFLLTMDSQLAQQSVFWSEWSKLWRQYLVHWVFCSLKNGEISPNILKNTHIQSFLSISSIFKGNWKLIESSWWICLCLESNYSVQ